MITFRDATPEDAPALARLGARSFFETFGHLYDPADLAIFLQSHAVAEWDKQLADPAFAVRVGEDGGQFAAFAKLGPPSLPFEPRGQATELRQFYLLQPWHGTGAARELMRWVLDEARRRRAEHLYLSVFTDNHRARCFYAKYGFVEEGPYTFMVGNHADEDIVMRLDL
ncbi:GNAT family N-acetyltransferase [Sphingomonas sp. GCM10030256]|uniref:GNAT family N-acetyltransferase n=1 Tax=Sphingomonas sp. GCM10030256 TaxID=3273427 RepID=UPI00361C787B